MRISKTTEASSTTTELYDASYRGGDNQHAGKWLVFPAGEVREVATFTSSNGRFGFRRALADAVVNDVEFEIWVEKHDPERINRYIDLAIEELNLRTIKPTEDDTFWLPNGEMRVDVPEGWRNVAQVEMLVASKSHSLFTQGTWEDPEPVANTDRFGYRVYVLSGGSIHSLKYSSVQRHDRYDKVGLVLYIGGSEQASVTVQFYREGILQHAPAAFEIPPGMWCYVTHPIMTDTPDQAGYDEVQFTCDRDVVVHMAELVASQANKWQPVNFSIERGGRVINLNDCVGPLRVRVRGGVTYQYMETDDTEAGAETAFLINQATAYAMVGIGREGEQYALSSFWEGKAREALMALPRLDGAMHL